MGAGTVCNILNILTSWCMPTISFLIKQKNSMNILVLLSPQKPWVQQVSEVCVKLQLKLHCRIPITERCLVKENFLDKGNSLCRYIFWIFASAFLPRVLVNQGGVGRRHSRSGRLREILVACCTCHWYRLLAKCLDVPHSTFGAVSITCICAWSPIRLALVQMPHLNSTSLEPRLSEGLISRCSVALSAVTQVLVCMNIHDVSSNLLRALWVSLVMSVISLVNILQALGTAMQS